jgi:threonine dehydratase
MNPSLNTARTARELLQKHLPISRLLYAQSLSTKAQTDVHLKLESDLPTGSFKPRGALYALATNLVRRSIREVTASSTGNHGAAVAFAASILKIPATIFLPANPNPVKRARIQDLGARIVEAGGHDLRAAFDQASVYSRTDGVYFLNDATDPDLPAGAASIALEIFDQLPSVETIVVPMGDTALIRGVAAVAKQLSPTARIIGVQAELAPAYFLSWKQGRAVSTETCDTIADGLATRVTEAANVRAIRELVDEVVLVSEHEMLDAIRHLAFEEHLIAEPAGAAATAALLQAKFQYGRHLVLLLTGANITPNVFRAAICGAKPEA